MRRWLFISVLAGFILGCDGDKKNEPIAVKPENTPITKPAPVPPVPAEKREHPLSSYDKTTISVEGHQISAYVADEPGKQQEGLMFVSQNELGGNEGMIFVMPSENYLSFWMKDTELPLDIAFLDSNGKILNIMTMKPFDESHYTSEGMAKYAVETHAGWFAGKGIKAGAKFDLSKLKR